MINGKKVVATIEARMSATRLPGKVLLPLAGAPVLTRIIERLNRSKYIDEICVATTVNPADDAIIKLCEEKKYEYFRGSEDDVLARVLRTAEMCRAEIIVEGMADSPLVDWRQVDYLLNMLVDGKYDYVSNEIGETFSLGFDMRVFPYSVLKETESLVTDPEHHEHVALYIYTHPEKYKIGIWNAAGKMRWPELRLTLDTPKDYELIRRVYDNFYPHNPDFSAEDVVDYLKGKPELYNLNADIKQKKPYAGNIEKNKI
ncbi:MAG: glycosyltransferase family protein [Patescibacteria group bacterium]|nr:glycosyltransferase family protein [Patescibacteria group bacterium]